MGSAHSDQDTDEYHNCASDSTDNSSSPSDGYDHRQHGKTISSSSARTEPSDGVDALTKLCRILSSYNRNGSTRDTSFDSFPPKLVKLLKHDTDPDVILLAARAITYLCEKIPELAGLFVSLDTLPVLCQRLHTFEYQELAEQCIQALEEISLQQPIACLKAGATMSILNSIDFFSTKIQRVAISTVERIYLETLHFESPFPLVCVEAIPMLCNLLQYEDPQLVEKVVSCLIMTGKYCAAKSPELLDEFCADGLIEKVIHLLSLTNQSQRTLSPLIYTGLIIFLGNLSSGSVKAFRTLHDHNVSSVLIDILHLLGLSNGTSPVLLVCGSYIMGYEVLKLLNVLLPEVTENQNDPLVVDKKSFLADRPYLIEKLEMDALPRLIQVVNSDPSTYVCHGCLSVIYKIVHFSQSDKLVEVLENTNISSCLDRVFTRKDNHVLILALQIVELILQKFSDKFIKLFIEEGVYFAIKSLSSPGKTSSRLNFSENSHSRVECPCYAFSYGLYPASSSIRICKFDKDFMYNLSKRIKAKYVEPVYVFKEASMNNIPLKLRYLSVELCRLLSISADDDNTRSQIEDDINDTLCEILKTLSGKKQVSAFEFVHSGILGSLVEYLVHGQYVKENGRVVIGVGDFDVLMEKQFEGLAKASLSVSKHASADAPLSSLTKNLQNALTISEAFPVILSGPHGPEVTSSFATVPNNCDISYPCLNIQFIKDEREACLKDFPAKYLTVDPFSSLHAIEGYLWPKVTMENPKQDNTKQEQLLNVAGQQLEKKRKKLVFYLDGQELVHELSLYQTLLCQMQKQDKTFSVAKLWNQVHTLCFRRAVESNTTILPEYVSNIETAATLFLLKKIHAYSAGEIKIPSNLKSPLPSFEQDEFLNKKLIEKLEQQMGDPLALYIGAMPFWCYQLMISYPFLFSYVTRCKFFKLVVYGQPQNQAQGSNGDPRTMRDRRLSLSGLPRKKCLVFRDRILESAAQMMNQHASRRVVLEVEYDGEVGTGFGPTLEFYNLICKEFRKPGLGMWREDTQYGLFPRPWLKKQDESNGLKFSEVQKKFVLLGQVVAKAIQDGRHLDLHISKAFYKLILGKKLSLYDIQSFDPELGSTLLEFHTLVNWKKQLESDCKENSMSESDLTFRNSKVEDLCLDFSLPGYDQTFLGGGPNRSMVNMSNLEDYVSLVKNATVGSGISCQLQAFRLGFNQVFPIEHLRVFSEEELELILCGEPNSWTLNDLLKHFKFDHGYTARSPPVANLLEILQEFNNEERRAFVQFVTGSPRLPPGGLASLDPKLTVVRKISYNHTDTDLPSVMTCTNYLKLPPYSSKERMKQKLLYAITEGQGCFLFS